MEAGTKTRAELKENWRDKTEAAAQLNGVDEEQQKVNNDDVMTNGYWITIKGESTNHQNRHQYLIEKGKRLETRQ